VYHFSVSLKISGTTQAPKIVPDLGRRLTGAANHGNFFLMKFLKVLFNALICGIVFSGLLALLILDININLKFQPIFFGQLSLFLMLSYGLLITGALIAAFFIIQFFSGSRFKIAVLSPSFLSLNFSLLLVLFFLIARANYHYFDSFFDQELRNIFNTQSLALFLLVLLGPLVFYGFHRNKKNILFYLIYFLLFCSGLSYLVWKRIDYSGPAAPTKVAYMEAKNIRNKLTVIGMEGLSFDFIIPLIAEEKLPNFSWLMEEGSWGKLESFSPNTPIVLNSSFNTGKYPSQHRRLSETIYRLLNFNQSISVTPRYIFFKQLTRLGILKIEAAPPESQTKNIWEIFSENDSSSLLKDWPYSFHIDTPSPKSETLLNQFFKDQIFEENEIFDIAKKVFFIDCEFEDSVSKEIADTNPQLVYFLLHGLNIVEANFYKYNFPSAFGDLEHEEINKYKSVIERYYQYYDQVIGKYLASLKEDELLVVYSPHGIEPLPYWKRIIEWILGEAEISAYHDNAPEGVIFFFGKEIIHGKNIEGIKLIDIAPTLLNYLGLPVGKDMDGVVNSSMLRPEYKIENPVLYISSYEEIDIKSSQEKP